MSRNMRHSLYPEGLLHDRKSFLLRDCGAPGISEPVTPTSGASKVSAGIRPPSPTSPIATAVLAPPRAHRGSFEASRFRLPLFG